MRLQPLVVSLVLLSSFAVAQSKAPAVQKPAARPAAQTPAKTSAAPAQSATAAAKPGQSTAKTSEVPETAPVITINGVCEGKAVPAAECKTVITRGQFEKILTAAAPTRGTNPAQLPPAAKRNLATQYAQLVAVATDAEKQGVQDTPEGQQVLKFYRMQGLTQAYSRMLQKKYEPTDAEIKAFYDANADKLQQATVERLVIPKSAPAEPKSADAKATDTKPAEDADRAKADKFRARAAAGEPFDTLQKEAIEGTATKSAPQTKMVVQKGTLPPEQESVFNLKPGEVSQLISEPGGYFIYKLDSKGPIPLEQVKNEIQQRLLQEKLQPVMEAIMKQGTPVLNENYFGPAPAATQVVPGPKAPQSAPTGQKPAPAQGEKPEKPPQPK